MAEFTDEDLSGSHCQHVDLSRAQFRAMDLTGVVMRDVELVDAAIDGEIWAVSLTSAAACAAPHPDPLRCVVLSLSKGRHSAQPAVAASSRDTP